MIDIKKVREEKNKTQSDVAELLGITRQTYSRIEKGQTELSLWQAVKLAEFLDIKMEEISWDTNSEAKQKDFDRAKYKQIIQNFVKYWSSSDWKITKTKLAKLCYLLDFTRYYYNLEPVTWLEYRKLQQWPVPDRYFSTLEELEEQEDIAIEQKGKAYLISNLWDIQKNLLSNDEILRIKKIAKKRQKANTKEIVNFTHKQLPWSICYEKEIIPYGLITQEELENVY